MALKVFCDVHRELVNLTNDQYEAWENAEFSNELKLALMVRIGSIVNIVFNVLAAIPVTLFIGFIVARDTKSCSKVLKITLLTSIFFTMGILISSASIIHTGVYRNYPNVFENIRAAINNHFHQNQAVQQPQPPNNRAQLRVNIMAEFQGVLNNLAERRDLPVEQRRAFPAMSPQLLFFLALRGGISREDYIQLPQNQRQAAALRGIRNIIDAAVEEDENLQLDENDYSALLELDKDKVISPFMKECQKIASIFRYYFKEVAEELLKHEMVGNTLDDRKGALMLMPDYAYQLAIFKMAIEAKNTDKKQLRLQKEKVPAYILKPQFIIQADAVKIGKELQSLNQCDLFQYFIDLATLNADLVVTEDKDAYRYLEMILMNKQDDKLKAKISETKLAIINKIAIKLGELNVAFRHSICKPNPTCQGPFLEMVT